MALSMFSGHSPIYSGDAAVKNHALLLLYITLIEKQISNKKQETSNKDPEL
jgi:hypothetical protein